MRKGSEEVKNNEEKKLPSVSINWYPGHMVKTKRQIVEDLKLIDVVIELLDARIPMSSRNPDIKEITKNKKKIILLNKVDLADDIETKKWQKKLSEEANCLLTDSNSGRGIDKVNQKIDELMEEERNRQALRGRINKTVRVMVLGIPNVGKSSFINRVSKKSSLEVANRPGVTREKHWIKIGKNQELLDTPGVLWPKFENQEVSLNLAFTGAIKDDILQITEISYEFLKRMMIKYKENILKRYNITSEEIALVEATSNTIYELMKFIAQKRGAIVSGGKVDIERISRIILDDFRSGRLGKITLERI